MVGLGIMEGSLELAVTLKVWASLAAPELIPLRATLLVPESSVIVKSPRGFRVGLSFTGVTVMLKVRVVMLFELPPSLRVKVIVAVPNAVATGVKASVPLVAGLV